MSVVAQLLKYVFSKPWSPPERKKKKKRITVIDFKDRSIIFMETHNRIFKNRYRFHF